MPLVLWHCWLGIRKSIQPVKNWVMGYWHGYLSGVWCKWFAYGPADATATLSSLASVKSRMVYLSGAGLPRLSWKKRPLNVCMYMYTVGHKKHTKNVFTITSIKLGRFKLNLVDFFWNLFLIKHCKLYLLTEMVAMGYRWLLFFRVVQKKTRPLFDCSYLQNVWTNLCDFWQTSTLFCCEHVC